MKHSPFAFFRKHQRVGMVILTVMAMFAFVFMDSISNRGGGGGANARANQVAVKIKGGNLTEVELQELKMRRSAINEFIVQLMLAVARTDEANKRSDQQLNQMIRM